MTNIWTLLRTLGLVLMIACACLIALGAVVARDPVAVALLLWAGGHIVYTAHQIITRPSAVARRSTTQHAVHCLGVGLGVISALYALWHGDLTMGAFFLCFGLGFADRLLAPVELRSLQALG